MVSKGPPSRPPTTTGRGERPTLKDVAARSFVSVSTASMALRGDPAISERTREIVVAAARELNYRPDSTARALRGGLRDTVVGVRLAPALTDDFGSASRLFAHRITRLMTDELERPGVVVSSITSLDDQRIAALSLFVAVGDTPLPPDFYQRFPSTPVFAAGFRSPSPTVVAQLSHDQDAIAEDLVNHLVDQGASRLGIIRHRQPDNYSQAGSAATGAAGARQGIAVTEYLVDFLAEDAARAARVAVGDGVDSIFLMLPFPGPVLDAIRTAGAEVPQDVMLVGRGEGTLEAQTNPPTSAMSMMAVNTGRLIIQGVDRFLAGETGIDMVAPHELIVRQSSLRAARQ